MAIPKIPLTAAGKLQKAASVFDRDASGDLDCRELRQMPQNLLADFFIEVVEYDPGFKKYLRLWVSQMNNPLSVRGQLLSRTAIDSLSDMRLKDPPLPGLAVDYENRHLRIEGLSREEGERELIFFAGAGKEGKIDKEEAWIFVEGIKNGKSFSYWLETGEDENEEEVSPNLPLLVEEEIKLQSEGAEYCKITHYHIHPTEGAPTDVYGFSPMDLSYTYLFQPSKYDGRLEIETRIVTPAGVYTLRPQQKAGEKKNLFQERFNKGCELFFKNHMSLRKQYLDGNTNFVEGSRLFAEALDRIVKEKMKEEVPFTVLFHPY